MISRIRGKVVGKAEQHLLLEVQGLTYEVLMPAASIQRLDAALAADGSIELITYHYHQVEPSRSIPVLIGFLSDLERDFFQAFITVSGIGPRAAVRALNKPISQIAQAIDDADLAFLKSLPGIGQQRAKEIVAKLQNKVGKFGLMRDARQAGQPAPQRRGYEDEALALLLQLGYSRQEAAEMMRKASHACPDISSTEELLNVVYKQRKSP